MRQRILTLIATLMLMVACSNTSTPDLTLILILYCGDDGGACRMEDDNQCEGRGTWNDFRENSDIRVATNMGEVFKRQDLQLGNFDEGNNTCTFSEDINMKSSVAYQITIGNRKPIKIMKNDLENQNWKQVLVFND